MGCPSPLLFSPEGCQFVVKVNVIVGVVDVIVVLVVALTVTDWGSAMVTALAGLWRHRGMVAVLAGV